MQKKSPIKENIIKYLEFRNITRYKFYQKSGITRGILDQETGISEENISKFLACYPEVDVNWLLTSEGQMIKNLEESSNLENTNLNSNAMSDNHLQKLFEMLESQQRVIASMAESNQKLAEANQIQARSFQSLIQKLQIEETPDENSNTSEGVKKSQAS